MRTPIKSYCDNLAKHFGKIPLSRTSVLEKIAHYIRTNQKENKPINLLYICTHNSRRSHFSQIWAQVASRYFNVSNVYTFSGGTETTAFNVNAINALKRIGFDIKPPNNDINPTFRISFGCEETPIICFSKVYDNPTNPRKAFAAIMTCSDAEANCPFIPGADWRISTTYEDPKLFDETPVCDTKYDETCAQIALETLYLFSKV